jgi:hypothetical protein
MSVQTENRASQEVGKATMDPLFDAEVRYRPDMAPVVSAEGREGELIGSGEGKVRGETIRGTMRVTFYAAECVFPQVLAGNPVDPGIHLCTENPGGFIETDDGAQIEFDGKGFGMRGFDPREPQRWRLTMGVRFATTDKKYRWLNGTLALWEGVFDDGSGRAFYRFYVPRSVL